MEKKYKGILILGQTARGKDTLANILQNGYGCGLTQVVSYTTRPKRECETDGKEHYFLPKGTTFADWAEKNGHDSVIAWTKIGDYEYWATRSELDSKDIYIIDPAGLKSLSSMVDINDYLTIFITCHDAVARNRAIMRGDDMRLYDARSRDEYFQFINLDVSQYDMIFANNGSIADLKEFATQVYNKYMGYISIEYNPNYDIRHMMDVSQKIGELQQELLELHCTQSQESIIRHTYNPLNDPGFLLALAAGIFKGGDD